MNAALVLPPPEYEPRDASPRRLLLVAGGLILGIALTLLSAAALYWTSYRDAAPLAPAGRQTAFQESPHVQSAIATDWSREDAAVREHLHTYGWIDRDTGTLRIPIDRAIDLLVEEANQSGAKEKK